ncbi:MAG: ISNCY family transposase [Erysipelotrichaceae bacterium]
MRKVELRMNELNKYAIIKKLVETNGNKKRAALKLNCTIRTINRLIIKYNSCGKEGFIHGNRSKKPSTTISSEIKDKVISIYEDKYGSPNLRHFSEILLEHENIKVSETTLNKWFREMDILSPKARKRTIRNLENKLKKQKGKVNSKKVKEEIENKIISLSKYDAHPRRSRCAYAGELIQLDASPHRWFNDEITHLHLAIDDAEGAIVGAYFDTQETLHAYYQVFNQILTDYGIPAKFLTDKRTVFTYKQKNAPSDEEDTFTQFAYACHQLGVELQCTSVPQAKGRVERLNQTLQSRLLTEMRIAGIQNIEQANEFLNSYVKKFNAQFSIPVNSTKNVYEKQIDTEKINLTLSILASRKIDPGHCVKYNNKYYIPTSKNGTHCHLSKGTSAMIINAFDGSMYVNILDDILALEEVPERLQTSPIFDEVPPKKARKVYIPPMSHPFKQASFYAFLSKQKHREEYVGRI